MNSNQKGNVKRLTTEYMEKQGLLQEQKLKRRKGLRRRLSVYAIGFSVFFVLIGITLMNQQTAIQEQNVEKQLLEEELLSLQNKESDLREEIELLQDPEYIAEIARRDYYLTFPNETLFQLHQSSTSSR
ncbi:septum formation initiator family protein [Evansella sp. AB-P1]|uniref:FtsB family cell division protein n=1 Tax=Evansella sp. AB-P1 TaxID=3037653 RepID=UPI00242041E0|nr:septum formation initiator family protein [Evansella sp. AB-P1]MDG5789992.1 septum formation initiator family protein [Evansella sp. AB-P1]